MKKKKHPGVSGGQPNLHIMAIAVPTGICYLWPDATRMSRWVPSNRHQLPSNRRQLPSNRRQLPSNRRQLPSNRRQLPSNRRQFPANSRRLPANRRPSTFFN